MFCRRSSRTQSGPQWPCCWPVVRCPLRPWRWCGATVARWRRVFLIGVWVHRWFRRSAVATPVAGTGRRQQCRACSMVWMRPKAPCTSHTSGKCRPRIQQSHHRGSPHCEGFCSSWPQCDERVLRCLWPRRCLRILHPLHPSAQADRCLVGRQKPSAVLGGTVFGTAHWWADGRGRTESCARSVRTGGAVSRAPPPTYRSTPPLSQNALASSEINASLLLGSQ